METEGKSKRQREVQGEYCKAKKTACDRAERLEQKTLEQKTLTISEIHLYTVQTHAEHRPRDWKHFCDDCLQPGSQTLR